MDLFLFFLASVEERLAARWILCFSVFRTFLDDVVGFLDDFVGIDMTS